LTRALVVLLTAALAACASPAGERPTATRTSAATPAPARQTVVLDIAVFDDSVDRPLADDFEVWVRGSGSWYPDVEFGADSRTFGEYQVGEADEFYIYPDGRDATEVRVEFTMQPDMIAGSDMARTLVEVTDSEVIVIGLAIPDQEQRFSR
jgi:hypothetical protein